MIKLRNIKKPPLMSKFVIFSTILFLFIVVAGSATFIFSMQQIIRENKSSDLSRLLEIERVRLETSVDKEISIVLKMAGSPLIQHYFSDPNNFELKTVASEEIDAYRCAFRSSKIFWVNNAEKIFHSDGTEPFILDPEKPENYWYNMTLYETESYNFNINYNPDIKVTNLWVNAPVFDDNRKPVGMVGTGIELSKFVNKIYEGYKGEAELYFFNAAGEITGARNIELISTKESIENIFSKLNIDILANIKNLKPEEVKILDVPSGKVAIGTVPLLGWYTIATMPSSISDYKTAMTVLFLVMMVVIAIIFVIFNIFISNLLKPLHRAMDELKAASKAKSDFLAKMSHEIRTPMNAITGMAELALREEIPNSAREHVITIKQAGANLLSIINDILDFSKIESGKLEIIPVNYQFSSLVHDVVSIIRMRVVDSELRFVVNIDCNVPNSLYGDETRVRQVFLNILSNAVKYTKKGYISFSVNGEITNDTILLTIDVTDSGKGIKQEDIGKLFGEFVQVDLAANKGIEGTGLGLVITKNLINAMDGDITVQSEYRKGSTFTIALPQKISSHEPLAVVENAEEKSVLVYEKREIYADSIVCTIDNLGVDCERAESDEELREKLKTKKYTFVFISYILLENIKKIMREIESNSKIAVLTEFGDAVADNNLNILAMPVYSIAVANLLNGVSDDSSYSTNENTVTRFIAPSAKILIIDDINTNLKVAEGLMLPYKMQIDSCLSGYEAIEAVKEKCYDLVFMDHMMPGMDGIEATIRIRELGNEIPHCQNMPIVALTANAVSGTKEMFLANKFDDFLSKPIDTVKLNDILAKWLPKEKQEKLKEGITESMDTVDQASTDLKINGIDVKKGIAMTGGKFEFYLQTLAIFHKEGVQKVNEIKKCLEMDDYDLYTIYVHALKSSLASIGSSELSETAKALEMAGKQSDFAFIKSNSVQFLSDFDSILIDIGKILANKNEKQEIPMDFEVLKGELNLLKDALEILNSSAIDRAVDNLQKFTRVSEVGASVENILQNILMGEYDEAVDMIRRILSEKNI